MMRPSDKVSLGIVLCNRLSQDPDNRISLNLPAMVKMYGITLEQARDAIIEIGQHNGFAIGIVDELTVEVMTEEEASRLLAMGVEIDEIELYGQPEAGNAPQQRHPHGRN